MNPSSSTIFFFLLLTFAAGELLSPPPPSSAAAIPPSAACNSSPDPAFCLSLLPPTPQPLYSSSRFSLAKSLSIAVKFQTLINTYLARRLPLPASTLNAVNDCRLLAGLNVDFLASAGAAVNTSSAGFLDPEADRLQTLLSALLTNHQTCLEGLREADKLNVAAGVLNPVLAGGSKLYGVSLALFAKAWAPRRKARKGSSAKRVGSPVFSQGREKGRHLLFHEVLAEGGGRLPLTMSKNSRNMFEGRLGRRLLQASDSVQVSEMVVVSADGTGNFTLINDAVASAPNNTNGSKGYYLIFVTAGVYEEYVSVPKNKRFIMMIGDGINQTVVTGNRSVVDGWTTFNSATFAVVGQGFVAINMTFQNTAGPAKHQAVALRSGADLSTFYLCSFEGYQDTLYAHSMRQFYTQCDISGTVDYIFGNAAAVFQDCNIYSRLPLQGQQNTVTAQGRTDPNQNTGISIQGGGFFADDDLAADNGSTKTYLGRPWKMYSRTVIVSSFMDELIQPAGWLPWDGDFALATLYYAEYNNTGPGSDTGGRVTWAGYHVLSNGTDALNFTVGNFILGDNWLPATGVPYTSGML